MKFNTLCLGIILATASAFGSVGPFGTQVSVSAAQYRGPCIKSLLSLKKIIDDEEAEPFLLPDKTKIAAVRDNFEPKVPKSILKLFKDDQKNFDEFVDTIAAQKVAPEDLREFLTKALRKKLNLVTDQSKVALDAAILEDYLILIGGRGVLVQFNENNYCIHCGYRPGSAEDKAIAESAAKRGRTYVEVPDHGVLDPSDSEYLKDLGQFLEKAQPREYGGFYNTILHFITGFVPEGLSDLSSDGQRAASYFMGIYMAEGDRFIETGLKTHSWQKDIFEATLVAPFIKATDTIYLKGSLKRGTPSDYFGVGLKGSGIGETRNDRKVLSSAICKAIFENEESRKIVTDLESIIGESPSHDVIQGLSSYANNPAHIDLIEANADKINTAARNLLIYLHDNAKAILKTIEKEKII